MLNRIVFLRTRTLTIIALLLLISVTLIIFLSFQTKRLGSSQLKELHLRTRVLNASKRHRMARAKQPDWLNGSASIDVVPSGFVVDTPSCRIPDFDAYNPSILPYIRDPDPYFTVCNHSLPVTFTDRQYVRLNRTLARSLGIHHCSYQKVF